VGFWYCGTYGGGPRSSGWSKRAPSTMRAARARVSQSTLTCAPGRGTLIAEPARLMVGGCCMAAFLGTAHSLCPHCRTCAPSAWAICRVRVATKRATGCKRPSSGRQTWPPLGSPDRRIPWRCTPPSRPRRTP